jgi:Uma2 family endonuclease
MKGKDIGKCVVAPIDVYLDDNTVVQPDVLFISKANLAIIKNDKIKGVPDLLIEVLSTNRTYDLKDKKSFMRLLV